MKKCSSSFVLLSFLLCILSYDIAPGSPAATGSNPGATVACPANTGVFPELPADADSSDIWTAQLGIGEWSAPSTWLSGDDLPGIPKAGDVVVIPDGAIVHVSNTMPGDIELKSTANPGYWPAIRYIRIEGELRCRISWDTAIAVETIYVAPSGLLAVGSLGFRVFHNRTCNISIMPKVITTIDNNIVVHSPAPFDAVWDPNEMTRGIIVDGSLKLYGEKKTHVHEIVSDVVVDPSLPTALMPIGQDTEDFEVGDEVALAGTTFHRGMTNLTNSPLSDDRFTLSMIGPDLGALAGDLRSSRLRAVNPESGSAFSIHMVNLSRNVILRSAWHSIVSPGPSEEIPISARGHLMIRSKVKIGSPGSEVFSNHTIEMYHVRIDQFGRTDKRIPLDDVKFGDNNIDLVGDNSNNPPRYTISQAPGFAGTNPSEVLNRRGRYGVHFHINGRFTSIDGLAAPAGKKRHVEGCVVTGTPGWGFVNHSSHVEFKDCVAYDFAGAGFVTESGDELGRFEGCLAMHGSGPEHSSTATGYFARRQVFGDWIANSDTGAPHTSLHIRFRPQPLSDFGFAGDGFWFQGPLIEAVDNVANSCSGAGMFWFTSGAVNDYSPLGFVPSKKERYAGFPLSELSEVYDNSTYAALMSMSDGSKIGPRKWLWSPIGEDMIVLADLPVLKMEGFVGYANLVGFRARFSNEHSKFLYNEIPFAYVDEIEVADFIPRDEDPSSPIEYKPRPDQVFKQILLWNNEQAFKARYCQSIHWDDVLSVNEIGGWNHSVSRIGAELNHENRDHIVENVRIYGYAMALLVQNAAFVRRLGRDNRDELEFRDGLGKKAAFVECDNYAVQGDTFGLSDLGNNPSSVAGGPFGDWPHHSNLPCIREFNFYNLDALDSTSMDPATGDWTVSWTGFSIHKTGQTTDADCKANGASPEYPSRYLIRYRKVNEPRFNFLVYDVSNPNDVGYSNGTQVSTVTIPGLGAGTYEFQFLPNMKWTAHPLAGGSVTDPIFAQPFGPFVPWSAPETATH